MKTIEYHWIDKSDWGDGPWQFEPDKIQWPDEATGLPCLIVRHDKVGQLCGYVGVPEGHPCFGKPAGAVDRQVGIEKEIDYADYCSLAFGEYGICHAVEPGESDRVWWLGFNCALGIGTLTPLLTSKTMIAAGMPAPPKTFRYFDVAYVRQQVGSLARQLAAIATRSTRTTSPAATPRKLAIPAASPSRRTASKG